MLVGNAGVGKTALVRNKLDCLPESYMTTKVPFNYYITSLMLQSEWACAVVLWHRGADQVNCSTICWQIAHLEGKTEL